MAIVSADSERQRSRKLAHALQRPSFPAPRIGLSVIKDHGGAVRRNKLKRVLREAFRMERAGMPPNVDVVLIPKKRDDNLPLHEVRIELPKLIEKALRAPKRPPRRRPR